MQQSSKGLKVPLDDRKEEKSAFKKVPRGKARKTSNSSDKRDSGYLTDNYSPFMNPGTPGTQFFTFPDNTDGSPANIAGNTTFFTFPDPDLLNDHTPATVPDDEDEEVEMVLNSPTLPSRSKPIPIHRPQAPIPEIDMDPPRENIEDDYSDVVRRDIHCADSSVNGVFRHQRQRHFRPISGRTVGTQTPNPHSQLITEAKGNVTDRFHPYHHHVHSPIARGTAYTRLRHQSEGEDPFDDPSPNLPDIIPVPRDRSVSLPNVHQREVEVGRELRRISDEFHQSYSNFGQRSRRHTLSEHQSSSFPGTTVFNFQNLYENLRQIFTSSPLNSDFLPSNMDNSHLHK